jgi:hypothetical protein
MIVRFYLSPHQPHRALAYLLLFTPARNPLAFAALADLGFWFVRILVRYNIGAQYRDGLDKYRVLVEQVLFTAAEAVEGSEGLN